MDLEKIAAQIQILRDRREKLPEIMRDYKPQRSAKAKAAPASAPVDNRAAEDIFSNLFVEAPDVNNPQ